MTPELVIALAGFALVSSITPGPNNLMLMASGANFGFRRTVPHMAGVGIGFVVMVILVGIGLSGLFELYPAAHSVLLVFSVLYLVWLAWKIARAAPPENGAAEGKPLTFLQAALFQWVNPKAWTMALTATTLYAPGQGFWSVMMVAAIFGAVNIPSISTWVLAGLQIRRWLGDPRRLIVFNWAMAGLLLASLYPVLFSYAG